MAASVFVLLLMNQTAHTAEIEQVLANRHAGQVIIMCTKALARIRGTLMLSAWQARKFIAADICGIPDSVIGATQILAHAIGLREKLGLGDANPFVRSTQFGC